MRTLLSASLLLLLASCSEPEMHPGLKGAALFDATGRATNTYACLNSQWALRERGQETLTDGSGRTIGTAKNDTYTTQIQGADGSALMARLDAGEKAGAGEEPTALVYTVSSRQGAGRFAQVATIRRSKPRGVGSMTRDCGGTAIERKVEYSVSYTFYGASASK